ncbi:MAG: DUF3459 domain-containing protein, partial [Anaerolineales bacterium]|nr:DUF3459 domain-containing protein [Anaerolineales bacterium]
QVINVKQALSRSNSLLNLYRQLLDYRRKTPALQWGEYCPIDRVPESCFAFTRLAETGPMLLVALNFASSDLKVSIPELGEGKIALSTLLDRSGQVDCKELNLRKDEGIIVELD